MVSLRTRVAFGLGLSLMFMAASDNATAAASGASFSCTDCPLRIADAGAVAGTPDTVASSVTVPAGICEGETALGGVEVRVDVLHAHVGDLQLRLRPPGGSDFLLLDRLADGSASAIAGDGSCAGDDIVARIYADVAAEAASCGEQIPAVGGTVTAAADLTALVAPVEAGSWTLEIGDHAAGGDGALRDWHLQFYCTLSPALFRDGFEGE